jgi:hypothetical protein
MPLLGMRPGREPSDPSARRRFARYAMIRPFRGHASKERTMKYMVQWRERSMGSPADYEGAQTRILSVFKHWQFPESIKVREFVIRIGDWGGYMLLETSDITPMHRLTTALPSFEFKAEAVFDIQDAVALELETMAWRDGL